MLEIFFPLWLGVLPLVVWHGGYEGPKVIWFLSGSAILIIYWIIGSIKNKKGFEFSKVDVAYFIWLVVLLFSSIINHNQESIPIGESYRHQGVVFFFALWIVGKTIQVLKSSEKRKLVKVLAVAVILECLVVLSQVLTNKLYFGKPLGTLGEGNAIAGYLVMSLYFVLESIPSSYLIFPLISLLLTQSRSGMLSAIPALAVYINSYGRKLKKVYLIIVGAIFLLFVAFVSAGKINSVFENRLLIWKLGIGAVFQKPFFGYGAESGQIVYDKAFRKMAIPLLGLVIDRSHNLFLDIAMWSGVIGLVPFCWWLFLSHRKLKIERKLAFYSFLIYSALQPLSVVHWVLLVVILNT